MSSSHQAVFVLRGGDAWDAAIRRRVRECALFMPLISANTEARSEGYFRREWNLAVHRMMDMAADLAFLMPVVIDSTPNASARWKSRSGSTCPATTIPTWPRASP
jgi:hypothetical protein